MPAAARTVADIIADLDRENPPQIGHNRAPLSTLEAIAADIGDLSDLARGTLTGDPLASEAQAAAVQSLVAQARASLAAADNARKAEKEPHLAAGRAVDAAFKPHITAAERVRDSGLAALAPWLAAIEKRQREEAAAAKRIADEAAAAALALSRQTNAADLDAVDAREVAIKAAAQAAVDATRADKARAVASSGEGRGVGLRSVWTAQIVNYGEYLAHLKAANPDRLKMVLDSMASEDVRAGLRELPGVTVTEERVAR